jgi:hypothetical protein
MAIATAASALPRRMLALPPSFPDELNALHRLLAFPEEVALKLTETEYELFNRVPPVDYLRHCTTDLTSRAQQQSKPPENGVPSLIRRFNEVSRSVISFIFLFLTFDFLAMTVECIVRVVLLDATRALSFPFLFLRASLPPPPQNLEPFIVTLNEWPTVVIRHNHF